MGKLSSYQEIACCNQYINGATSTWLGKLYDTSPNCIRYILAKHGINRRPSKILSDAQESWMCKAYSKGMGSVRLGRLFGVSTVTAYRALKRHNVDTRLHRLHVDELFFKRIDTLEKAYWLGFITADGYIYKSKFFRLALSFIDEPHLEKLKSALQYNGIIRRRVYNGYSYSELCVHNKTFVNYLGNVVDRHKVVSMPKNLLNHFVRGIIDGDGCIMFWVRKSTGRRYLIVKLCGKKSFLLDFINQIPFSYNGSFYSPNNKVDIYSMQFSGSKAFSFLNWLYNGSTESTRLDRKYEIYLKALSLAQDGKLGGVK